MKERNSNLEALRILAILFVLYIHAFGLISGMGYTILGREVTTLVNCVSNVGVSCFILISGYFGIKFHWKKLFKLELMVISYSLCMTLLILTFFPEMKGEDGALELLIKSCIPVVSRKYWFYSCYICLMLLSPFINQAIEEMEKKTFQHLLFILLILFSIFPTFLYFEITLDHGKGLVNMVMLYMMGRWIGMYGDVEIDSKKGWSGFFFLLGINYLSCRYAIRLGGIRHDFTVDNSITNILMAVALLYLFKGVHFKSQFINRTARHVFAVFVLNTFVMTVIHTHVLKIDLEKIRSNWMPLWITGDVVLTLLICLGVDIVRQTIFSKLEYHIIEFADRIRQKIVSFASSINIEKVGGWFVSYRIDNKKGAEK